MTTLSKQRQRLRAALRAAAGWQANHADDLRGRLHVHSEMDSTGGLVVWGHLLTPKTRKRQRRSATYTRVYITKQVLEGADITAFGYLAKSMSEAFHRRYHHSGHGCLVCEPEEVARVAMAMHHVYKGEKPIPDEEVPLVMAARFSGAGNPVAAALVLRDLLGETDEGCTARNRA